MKRRKISRLNIAYTLTLVGLLILTIYTVTLPKHISPKAYAVLLDTIAEGESKGNYNAYFGNAANTSFRLTDMSIAQVLDWQKKYVGAGNPSSAAGRYQIIQPTLEGLVQQLNLSPDVKFNETLQDTMAITLIERRGAQDFVEQKLSAEQFAENLSKEWAALPQVTGDTPTESYYAGDGLNESKISISTILGAISEFKMTAHQ